MISLAITLLLLSIIQGIKYLTTRCPCQRCNGGMILEMVASTKWGVLTAHLRPSLPGEGAARWKDGTEVPAAGLFSSQNPFSLSAGWKLSATTSPVQPPPQLVVTNQTDSGLLQEHATGCDRMAT